MLKACGVVAERAHHILRAFRDTWNDGVAHYLSVLILISILFSEVENSLINSSTILGTRAISNRLPLDRYVETRVAGEIVRAHTVCVAAKPNRWIFSLALKIILRGASPRSPRQHYNDPAAAREISLRVCLQETVLSRQIEGRQSVLAHLLRMETKVREGQPNDDILAASKSVNVMMYGVDRSKTFPLFLQIIRALWFIFWQWFPLMGISWGFD